MKTVMIFPRWATAEESVIDDVSRVCPLEQVAFRQFGCGGHARNASDLQSVGRHRGYAWQNSCFKNIET